MKRIIAALVIGASLFCWSSFSQADGPPQPDCEKVGESASYTVWVCPTTTSTSTSTSTPPTTTTTTTSTTTTTVAPTTTTTLPPTALTNRPAQSFAFVYGTSMTNVASYAQPGGLVVTGRDNYSNTAFKNVSAGGGTVLVYFDAIVSNNYGTYHALLFNSSVCGPAVPLWPGNVQANQWGYLADFRVGGILQSKLECVLERMVADNPHMGGFFLDDVGSRSWFPNFNWGTFGATNQADYRAGAIAAVQTARTVANRHRLAVFVNGTWGAGTLASNGGGYPNMNLSGMSLADGALVEHHSASELPYWTAYATSAQWASATTGVPFLMSTTTSTSDRTAYVSSGAFAFVNTQSDYGAAPAPWGPLHPTGLPSSSQP